MNLVSSFNIMPMRWKKEVKGKKLFNNSKNVLKAVIDWEYLCKSKYYKRYQRDLKKAWHHLRSALVNFNFKKNRSLPSNIHNKIFRAMEAVHWVRKTSSVLLYICNLWFFRSVMQCFNLSIFRGKNGGLFFFRSEIDREKKCSSL